MDLGAQLDFTARREHIILISILRYFNGCDGAGADCESDAQHGLPERLTMDIGTSEDCNTAFHVPTDTGVQVACQADDVGHLSVVDFFCSSHRC